MIEKNADTDADIIEILNGADNMMPGMEPNVALQPKSKNIWKCRQ